MNARTSDSLSDLCDGARYARIQAALPKGSSALTSILFFDEIQRDEKGIVSGEGIIIVGGFFKKDARESSYAKVSLGTFPTFHIPKADATRVVVAKFKKAMRASQHAAIAQCYRDYNAKGGHIIPLQTGRQVYFPKAVVLAIFADFPATQKVTLTGSACPKCFTPQDRMSRGRRLDNEVICVSNVTFINVLVKKCYIPINLWVKCDIMYLKGASTSHTPCYGAKKGKHFAAANERKGKERVGQWRTRSEKG